MVQYQILWDRAMSIHSSLTGHSLLGTGPTLWGPGLGSPAHITSTCSCQLCDRPLLTCRSQAPFPSQPITCRAYGFANQQVCHKIDRLGFQLLNTNKIEPEPNINFQFLNISLFLF